MSFALRHAERHGLRRVIVVIPYTSIIEQNAAEYARALGPENVIEHHSGFDPAREAERRGEQVCRRRELACENWDAPVIVTTSVQFFESLFANSPSRCRKLHNVARSVLVLDEVQTIPPAFLLCIVEALGELVDHYGCSAVLTTATPPALAARQGFPQGLRNLRDILPGFGRLAERLRRVEYTWPRPQEPPVDWPTLAGQLARHRQVLAVVHRRADARLLAKQVQRAAGQQDVFHLSALMCPAHRSDVLARIRRRLAAGEPCRVISTQLVEAGVDVDFPVVYRAMAGLDSIVQAAGRCNREGRLESGRVVVFRAPTSPPAGTPRKGAEAAEAMLREAQGPIEPDDPMLVEDYFRRLYFTEHPDAHGVQAERQEFNFATVSRKFNMIEDGFARSVVVPYGQAPSRLDALRRDGPSRATLRALQPFLVSVYPNSFDSLLAAGALNEVAEGVFELTAPFHHLYDSDFGLVEGDEPRAEPEGLIC